MLKSLMGEDWSVAVLGVQSNPLRLVSAATSAPELPHDMNRKDGAVRFLPDDFCAPHPGISDKPPVSIRNHKAMFYITPIFKQSREHGCLTQPVSKHRLHANEFILLIH